MKLQLDDFVKYSVTSEVVFESKVSIQQFNKPTSMSVLIMDIGSYFAALL